MVILNHYRIRFEKSFTWRIFAFLIDTLGFPFALKKVSVINKSNNLNILTIRKDELGDAVLSLPIYEAIKKKYPISQITVLVSKYTEEIFKNNPFVDNILIVEPFWKKGIFEYIKGG